MSFLEDYDRNWNNLKEQDKQAKESGVIVGRYIQHQYADGHAIYTIVKENKNSVRIEHCALGGDDWVLPAWGYKATIDKNLALTNLNQRDRLAEIFSRKRA